MPSEPTMDMIAEAGLALDSIPSPRGANPIQWEELDGNPAITQFTGMDAPHNGTLDLRIELGRTCIDRDEALKLRTGSVVPLDNAAGGAVNLYAAGQWIARGEAVSLDGRLGVRIVEIISRVVRN
jgi:flagellar motor switch/type III secretory pathway protein FliN